MLRLGFAGYVFVATVDQDDADSLFSVQLDRAEVRLHGEAKRVNTVRDIKVIPAEQSELPSTALGWVAGGDVPTNLKDPEGKRADKWVNRREYKLINRLLNYLID